MSRTGKIARLPQSLREELNHRLENGEPGKTLIDWLNTLPEVTALLATHFENRPISEQNLSDWKRGGFVEWQLHRDLLFTAGACAEDSAAYAACGLSAKHFLAILNAHFASSLQAWDGSPDGQPLRTMRLLKYLYTTALALRRGEQQDERLALHRERLELAREKQTSYPQSTSASSPIAAAAKTPPAAPPPQPASHHPLPPPPEPTPHLPTACTSLDPSTPNSPEQTPEPSIPTPPSAKNLASITFSPATPPLPARHPTQIPMSEAALNAADWTPDEPWLTSDYAD